MATRQSAFDRGKTKGIAAIRSIGSEIRTSRRSLGLSLLAVGSACRLSASELSRIERGLIAGVSLVKLAEVCAIVGLDLTARAYPSGPPLRDARHGKLLGRFHGAIHSDIRWGSEVPLPNPGDQRAWDAVIRGDAWRYGVEAELNPIDGQALLRRLTLKQRDGMVDGVILLMPDTRQVRLFKREFAELLAVQFPVKGSLALRRLATGLDPGGSAIVVL